MKNVKHIGSMLLCIAAVSGLGGCTAIVGDPMEKLGEADAPVDGKLDGAAIKDEGELVWEDDGNEDVFWGALWVESELSADFNGVAFTFDLSDEATITLQTESANVPKDEIDTVLYVYKANEQGRWGRYVARNDDRADGDLWSQLEERTLDAGHYRVVIKGYGRQDVGTFVLSGSCEGNGCL